MTHTRFQIQCVLFEVRVAILRLGDLNNHICYKFSELFSSKSGCLSWFWLHESVLNACFLYSGHPLYEATCGPLQFAQVGFLDSLLGHPLCECRRASKTEIFARRARVDETVGLCYRKEM